MRYKIVFLQKGLPVVINLTDRRSLANFSTHRGWTKDGIERGAHLRKELRGEPKFKEMCGPMFDGPGVVRYESWEVYERLSR